MKNLRSLLIVPAVLVLALAVVVTPAAAERGSDDSNSSSTSSSSGSGSDGLDNSGSDSNDDGSSTVARGADENEVENEALTEDSLHQRADEMLQNLLSHRHGRQSEAVRGRKCQAAEHGLEKKLGNLQNNAARHQALVDKVYSEALAYQQQNNINPDNFSSLVDAANAAQTKASQSVSVLDGLSVNLDCADATVATNVATFKVAAKQARADLLDYRTAVRAVLQALESAKE